MKKIEKFFRKFLTQIKFLFVYFCRLIHAIFLGFLHWFRIFKKIELKDRKRFLAIKIIQKFTILELIIISILFLIIIICSGILIRKNYIQSTSVIPANGGSYIEGVVGEPKYVNPILASGNDTDMVLCSLVFSGLTKYNKNGELVGDLASRWEVSPDNKTYTFYLNNGVLWHDKKSFTADDVIFTIEYIQNPAYTGTLSNIWKDVKVEKIDDLSVKFTLPSVYIDFLSNTTLGILPRHHIENIAPADIWGADFNLQPIGTGPYKFSEIKKDKNGHIQSITLMANNNYYRKRAYINRITFKFYSHYMQILEAYRKKEIQGLDYISPEDVIDAEDWKGISLHRIVLPQYTAVFFNVKSKLLEDNKTRKALAYAVDKQKILQEILNSEGQLVESPILPGFLGYNPDVKKYSFNLEEAKNLLEQAGWQDTNGDGIREKEGLKLEFNLLTVDKSLYGRTAQIICDGWKDLGVNVEVIIYDSKILQQDYINLRNYDALLYGENLGRDPDPYPYWHSTQAEGSGLNLSSFSENSVDEILEEARQSVDCNFRSLKYMEFQNIIVEEVPAIFLFNPNYIYGVSEKVKGIDLGRIVLPYERFLEISDWYIETKRVPK